MTTGRLNKPQRLYTFISLLTFCNVHAFPTGITPQVAFERLFALRGDLWQCGEDTHGTHTAGRAADGGTGPPPPPPSRDRSHLSLHNRPGSPRGELIPSYLPHYWAQS